jgi:F-type H+-transporting ATPase subunit a
MKKRHIIYACLIGLLIITVVPLLKPALPVIQLPGELVWRLDHPLFEGTLLEFPGITNTFIATLLTFVIIMGIAIGMKPSSRSADEVPSGLYNFFEMIMEMAYNYVENAAGKWARTFFPFFMTFILWIVIANWMELVPLVDSLGKWETTGELAYHTYELDTGIHPEGDLKKEIEEAALEADTGGLRRGMLLFSPDAANPDAELQTIEHHGHEEYVGMNPDARDWAIVPFVRAAATDLNFTIALAIISVVMTQYYGMKAQGMKYWSKFFSWDGDAIAKSPLAVITPAVGLLEFVSEVFKIVSFAFRLLGNIFAGQILLFVIGSLLPIGNLLFWHLEFGVGLLQGVVFALLTLTFMKAATEEVHH